MSKRILIQLLYPVLLGIAGSCALANEDDGTIYRTVDAEGRVIFSDKASEKSSPVTLPPTNTMPEVSPTSAPVKASSTIQNYSQIQILEPTSESTVTAINGLLTLRVAIEPPLYPGHTLQLLIDGEPMGEPVVGEFAVPGVARGPHELQLVVLDQNGTSLQRSGTVTVQVTQPARQGARPR